MDGIRTAVIGIGNMGSAHAACLYEGKIPGLKLAAVCDGYSLPAHEYAFDINKNHWTWQCTIIGPLQWDEVVTSG